MINSDDIIKHNKCAQICKSIYNKLKNLILNQEVNSIEQLYKIGQTEIEKECHLIYKKITNKGVSFPVHIIINSDPSNNNEIKLNDIVFIKLGVYIEECKVIYSDTFINNKTQTNEYILFLYELKNKILKLIHKGNTNDEIRIFIESQCTMKNCFPLVNCTSYQHSLETEELQKYILLNYKNLDDKQTQNALVTDYLIPDNLCFDFNEYEIYTINLSIVPDNTDQNNHDISNIKYIPSSLYQLNNDYYSFKLKASREFYNEIYSIHQNNVFNFNDFKNHTNYNQMKLGMKECLSKSILSNIFFASLKNKSQIYTHEFTIYVKKNKSIVFE